MKRSASDDMWALRTAVVPKTNSAVRSPGVRISSVYRLSASRTASSSRDGPRSVTHMDAEPSMTMATSTSPRLKVRPPNTQ